MDRRVYILDNEIDFDEATRKLQELDSQIVTNHEFDIMMHRYKFVVLFPANLVEQVNEIVKSFILAS